MSHLRDLIAGRVFFAWCMTDHKTYEYSFRIARDHGFIVIGRGQWIRMIWLWPRFRYTRTKALPT